MWKNYYFCNYMVSTAKSNHEIAADSHKKLMVLYLQIIQKSVAFFLVSKTIYSLLRF